MACKSMHQSVFRGALVKCVSLGLVVAVQKNSAQAFQSYEPALWWRHASTLSLWVQAIPLIACLVLTRRLRALDHVCEDHAFFNIDTHLHRDKFHSGRPGNSSHLRDHARVPVIEPGQRFEGPEIVRVSENAADSPLWACATKCAQ